MYPRDDWGKCLEDFFESQVFRRIKTRARKEPPPWGGTTVIDDEPEHPGDFISPFPEAKAIAKAIRRSRSKL
jgi:hypothetical protein